MPIAIGLLPSQQESFEHHEELSKLLNETDVFYVPFQNDFHNNQDLSNLIKRFDEDILNKHLVVTFRDIGYSLYLDSVQSIPDQNDQSKIRISGKMIVDGICIQFLGRFDCHNKTHEHSDVQQINGVGRIQLDEDYYRELSSSQKLIEENMESTEYIEAMTQTDKLFPKTKARSRTISENLLGKNHNHILKSPPSSLSNSRSRLHSPYTIRSPRTITHVNKQHYQASSPINIDSSSVSRSSGFHSSFISPSSSVPSSFNENPMDLSQHHHIPILSQSPHHPHSSSTMPIQIPSSTSTNLPLPPGSLPQLTGIFPITQSHSLPTYFLPRTNLAYFITNTNQNPSQPLHIITPLNHPSLQYPNTHYSNVSYTQSNSHNEYLLQNKINHSNDLINNNTKQLEEQLPLKKRRYTGQQQQYSPMDINHDDDEASNESVKK